ncbi:hypothetical protein CL618_03375 [archaeon]|nr:hypothetical protein [archaeon]|tara:strand:- start:73 stop:921 length:849 start_codon:yes stop_codon:yes gene_type:complete
MENFIEKQIGKVVGNAAAKIARDINSNCIISIAQKENKEYDEDNKLDVRVTIFRKNQDSYKRLEYTTEVNKVSIGSVVPIKEVLMEAVKKEYILKGDKVVCVQDESMGGGYKALMFIFDVDKIFFNISMHELAEFIDTNVLETILNICLELGREGREGRKIGTAFVIGDEGGILRYTKQLIINPFAGYEDEKKNILDPDIKETIKEFAQLDGIFVVNEKGVIARAGAYIDVDTFGIELKGLGGRHRSCAAITKKTGSIAVVVSESGGLVRVLKDGKIVMKLP